MNFVMSLLAVVCLLAGLPQQRARDWRWAEQRLTFDGGTSLLSYNFARSLAANVYVAWVDTRDGNEEEYFRRSADGGQSWEPITRLTANGANSWAPSLAVDGETVHFVWFDQQDSPIQPLDAEKHLDDVMRRLGLSVDPAPAGVMVPNPELAAQRRAAEKARLIEREAPAWIARGGDAARLHAIMRELQEMGERGASYLEKERKLNEALALMGLPYTPGATDDLPKVYYLDAMQVRVQDKLKQILATIPAWVQRGGDPQQLEAALQAFQQLMSIAISEWEIYYQRSLDGGRTWEPAVRLSVAPSVSARPSIALDGRDLHVVWYDGRDGNAEVYARHSPDGGTTWEPDVRLTDAPGDSLHPCVAGAQGRAHVVWFDRRDGNAEIYYRSLILRPRHDR